MFLQWASVLNLIFKFYGSFRKFYLYLIFEKAMYCASESFVYIYIVFIFTKHTGEWILEIKISFFLFLLLSE